MKPWPERFLLETMIGVTKGKETSLSAEARLAVVKSVQDILFHRPGTWHVNGFYKITVFEDDDERISLRIHLWPKGCQESAKSNIHAHAWDFCSYLVGGALLQTIYRESADAPEVASKFVYKGGSHSDLRLANSIKIKRISFETLNAGQVYHSDATTLHKIESVARLGAVTLVLTRNRQIDKDVTVVRLDGLGKGKYGTKKMDSGLGAIFNAIMEN